MRAPRFGNKKPGRWQPRNSRERHIREENIEAYLGKRKSIGEMMYNVLGCTCKGKDISSAFGCIKNPSEFLDISKGNESEIFPAGFHKQPTQKTAKHIYKKARDRLNFDSFARMLSKYSTKDYSEDATEHEKYYYICRISARFERAGVYNTNISALQKFYEIVSESDKEDAFDGFFRGARTVDNMWGKEHMQKLGVGRIILSYRDVIIGDEVTRVSIRNWCETKIDNLEKKIPVFDSVSLIGKPWVDAIYLGTNVLAEYIKSLSK